MDQTEGTAWTGRIHERLRAVYDRVGVIDKKPTHALRRTLASDLVLSGAPIYVAQKHLGHASASVTLGIYAHAHRAELEQGGKALEKYRRGR